MARLSLTARIGLNTTAFRRGIQRVAMIARKLRRNVIAPIGKAFRLAFGAVLAGATLAVAALNRVTKRGDDFAKMGKRTGFATDELQRYAHAAELSGTSIESLEKGIKRMSKFLFDAERGLSTATDALAEMGITSEELQGKTPEEAFDTLAMRIAKIEDPLRKAAVAQDVFGRAGTQLLPMLNGGADALRKMKAEADRLGIVMSPEQLKASEKFRDGITRLKAAFDGFLVSAIGPHLPSLAIMLEDLRKPLQNVLDGALDLWESGVIQNWAADTIDALEPVLTAFDWVADKIEGVWETITEKLKGIRTGIEGAAAAVGAFVSTEGDVETRAAAAGAASVDVPIQLADERRRKREEKERERQQRREERRARIAAWEEERRARLAAEQPQDGGVEQPQEVKATSLQRIGANAINPMGQQQQNTQKKMLTIQERHLKSFDQFHNEFRRMDRTSRF